MTEHSFSRVRIRLPHLILWLTVALALGTLLIADDVADPDPDRWTDDIEAFRKWDAKNSPARDAVLFIGSSSIVLWQTARDFPGTAVINRGFGGAHISDILHYFDDVVAPYADARMIVFYCGDNDVADGKSPEQVHADWSEFLRRVRERMPGTPIVYVPIKPSLARWEKWPLMSETNRRILEDSRTADDLRYADTATPMLGEDGKPLPDLFVDDGLHLSDAGYTMWTEVLRPYLTGDGGGEN